MVQLLEGCTINFQVVGLKLNQFVGCFTRVTSLLYVTGVINVKAKQLGSTQFFVCGVSFFLLNDECRMTCVEMYK